MELGVALPYALPQVDGRVEFVKTAERLGYTSVWSAEIYGSDAITPLAFLAGQTDRIKLGTGVAQLAARSPANAAMSIATVDQLAGGGRTILGLGVSGPQIVEGWYGQPWGSPVARLRDYITIVRKVLDRETVTHDGAEIALPYTGPGAVGVGKPLKLILHPPARIPIYLGCGGPASVALMAELCDGWLPLGMSPDRWEDYRPHVERGLARAGGGKTLDDLWIQGSATVVLTDDVEGTLARQKSGVAMRVGGYGSADFNFHRDAMIRRGYGDVAEKISELFLAGRRDEAIAAVPDSYVDDTGLYGDADRIRQRFQRWVDGPYQGITVHTDDMDTLEILTDAVLS